MPRWNAVYNATGAPEHLQPTKTISVGEGIDYDKLGRSVAKAMVGMKVELGGRQLGAVTLREQRRLRKARA